MITCVACGTENPDTATYCAKCARKLDAATQQEVTRIRQEHTTTGIRWPAVLVAVVVAITIVLVVLFVTHVL